MKLEGYERIEYKTNPLIEVLAKFDFPSILEIDLNNSDSLSKFQNKIRANFPKYEFVTSDTTNLDQFGKIQSQTKTNFHIFKSLKSLSSITICKSHFAYKVQNYSNYNDFEKSFFNLWKIFSDIYQPSFITRIGLRYINIVDKNKIFGPNNDKQWFELVKKDIVPEVYEDQENNKLNCKAINKTINFNIGDEGDLRLVIATASEVKTNAPALLVDIDLYISNEEGVKADESEILRKYNGYARNIFRSCISESLHETLKS